MIGYSRSPQHRHCINIGELLRESSDSSTLYARICLETVRLPWSYVAKGTLSIEGLISHSGKARWPVDQSQQFLLLMNGLRAGEQWAAEELCRSYGPLLRAVVRRHLHSELRSRFDSLDFVQEVWASFLALPGNRYTFESPDALRRFLTRVVQNKVVEVWRQCFGTQKYDIRRELPLEAETSRASGIEPASSGPTPSWCAMAAEEWERLLSRFPAGHRTILIHLREGHDYEDITRLTGISPSTIKRIVRRLKEITGL